MPAAGDGGGGVVGRVEDGSVLHGVRVVIVASFLAAAGWGLVPGGGQLTCPSVDFSLGRAGKQVTNRYVLLALARGVHLFGLLCYVLLRAS